MKLFYRKYPKVIEVIMNRHNVYNSQIAFCENLEKEGKAVLIRPVKPLKVKESADRNIENLLELYDEGYDEAKAKIDIILKTRV